MRRLILYCLAAASCGPRVEEPREDPVEPGIYAAALCGAIEDCDCTSVFSSQGECENEFRARFLSLMESGPKLDEACFERVVEGPELGRCASKEDPEYEQTGCTVLEGTKREGEACSGHQQYVPPFYVEECEGGLKCSRGRCRLEDELVYASEGLPCFLGEGKVRGQGEPPILLRLGRALSCDSRAKRSLRSNDGVWRDRISDLLTARDSAPKSSACARLRSRLEKRAILATSTRVLLSKEVPNGATIQGSAWSQRPCHESGVDWILIRKTRKMACAAPPGRP